MKLFNNTERPSTNVGIRVLAFALGVTVAVYMITCTISELPSSPVQIRAANYTNKVINPWFEQDWQLFAPAPPTSNNAMQVTAVTKDSDGVVTQQAPFDMESILERMPLSNHVTPTKMPGISLAADERFNDYETQLAAAQKLKEPDRTRTTNDLNQNSAVLFDELARSASYFARAQFPGKSILKLRVEFTKTDITPFSQRSNDSTQPTKSLMTTSWLPYHDVASDQ